MHEVAANGCTAEDIGKLGVREQPVGVQGGPVVVSAIGDAVDDVVNLAGLVKEITDSVGAVVHPTTLRAPQSHSVAVDTRTARQSRFAANRVAVATESGERDVDLDLSSTQGGRSAARRQTRHTL